MRATEMTMPDGTTFQADTLEALAGQWAAWVHGQGWDRLTKSQQEQATRECTATLRRVLGVQEGGLDR